MSGSDDKSDGIDRYVTVGHLPEGERYAGEQLIGAGGMGQVERVNDRRLRRRMAMKRIDQELRVDNDMIWRFVQEAQITGQLDHPNIVPVYELGRLGDRDLYFTMKEVAGETLHDVLHEMGRYKLAVDNLERLIDVLLKVCDALSFAHSRGVVHRDVKPGNIMVGQYGQVYLLDWGLAHLTHGAPLVSEEERVLGTPGYMAPEQATGETDVIDARTDVYGVGGLVYHLLTDQSPHPEAAYDEQRNFVVPDVMPPQQLKPGVALPHELCRIAMKALAPKPADRYQSVDAMREDLAQFRRHGGWLRTRSVSAGDRIMGEGNEADAAYIIVQGECEAYKQIAGQEQVLRKMGPGEVFGEAALLLGGRRTASVRAVTDATLKVVTRATLARELEGSDWLKAIMRVIAERFAELDATITEMRQERREDS